MLLKVVWPNIFCDSVHILETTELDRNVGEPILIYQERIQENIKKLKSDFQWTEMLLKLSF